MGESRSPRKHSARERARAGQNGGEHRVSFSFCVRTVAVPVWAACLLALWMVVRVILDPLVSLMDLPIDRPSSSAPRGGGGEGGGGGRAAAAAEWLAGIPTLGLLRGPLAPSRSSGSGSGGSGAGAGRLDDETNVAVPRRSDGTAMTVEERLRYLELKSNAYMNFGTRDPFFGSREEADKSNVCRKPSRLKEFGCRPGWEGYQSPTACHGFGHTVCLDRLPPPREWDPRAAGAASAAARESSDGPSHHPPSCLVYDFGIRDQVQFGAVMARVFGCEVHAFDPSPISVEAMKKSQFRAILSHPNYHFHPYGGGGIDGNVTLHTYDWGQVSIIRYPKFLVDCGSDGLEGNKPCKTIKASDKQDKFTLPVKTLPTIRRELGHEGRKIDVLKLDIEGSEYALLEDALDKSGGCLDYVDQLALEWHHMPWDPRYGEGSSPPINAIVTLLRACGLTMFHAPSPGGWPSNERIFQRLGMRDMRYNLASFLRKEGQS